MNLNSQRYDAIGNRSPKPQHQVLYFGRRRWLASLVLASALAGTVQAQGFPADGVIELSSLNTSSPDSLGVIINGNDRTGNSVSSAGDINGDGLDDVVIGAALASPNATFAGQSFVLFGRGDGFPDVIELASLSTASQDTPGLVINGFEAGGISGRSVSSAGDINGDGIDDLVIGGNLADAGGTDSGQTHVLFGRSDGFPNVIELSSLGTATPDSPGLVINGLDPEDSSGFSVSGAGDFNDDGIDDLLIGASNAIPVGDSGGAIVVGNGQTYVLFGRNDGFPAVIELASLETASPDSPALTINGINLGDVSGSSVSDVGDVNGDDIDDILIGARSAGSNGTNFTGQSYLLFGRSDGFPAVVELSSLTTATPDTPGVTINGIAVFDRSGNSVSGAGDVNGDGLADFLIAAENADPNGDESGQIYLLFGRSDGFPSVINLSSLTTASPDSPGLVINGIAAGDNAGQSVSGAGDVNNDGFADLLIGADNASPNGDESGQSYLLFGRSTGFPSVIELSTLSTATPDASGLIINGVAVEDNSGRWVSGAGDINGDGFADFMISAENADPNGDRSGQSYILFGTDNTLPVNTVPGAQTILEDTVLLFNGNLSVADADNDQLMVLLSLSQPTDGGLTVAPDSGAMVSNDGSAAVTIVGTLAQVNAALNGLGFSPALNVVGDVDLSISTDDGTAPTVIDTVTISVTPVNDPPTFALGGDQTLLEDAGAQTVAGFITAIDDGDPEVDQTVTISISNNNNVLFSTQPSVDASGVLTYTPVPNANGTATVSITAMDSGGTANGGIDTSSQTFDIIVTPVNDAPSFVQAGDQTILEDAGTQTVAGFVTDIDDGDLETAQTVAISTANNNNGLFNVQPGIDASGNLTYTPAADASGIAIVTVTAMDSGGTANGGIDTSSQTFNITVTAVNDAPTFTTAGDQTVLEDAGMQTVTGFVTGIDDGDPAAVQTVTITASNDNNALFDIQPVIINGELTYTPVADANGVATVTVTAMDDGGTDNGGIDSSSQTFNITVTAVNDAPTFTMAGDQTVLEDAGMQTLAGFVTAIDDGDPEADQTITITASNNSNALFSVQPMITNGELAYTPAADANGVATVTVTAMDDGGTGNGGVDSSSQTFDITVIAVNDVPSYTVGPDQEVFDNVGPLTINPWATGISAGPSGGLGDESGQALTFNITSNTNPAIFAVAPSVDSSGALSFVPAIDAQGNSTISLELMDNGGIANGGVDTSPTQTFNIQVNASNADLELSISNTAQPPIFPGDDYSYLLDIVNNGPGIAANTQVDIVFARQLRLSDAGGCVVDNGDGSLSWAVGELQPLANAQCIFDAEVLLPGTITITGTAGSDLNDPTPANSTDISNSVIADVIQVPTLSRWALGLLASLLALFGWRRKVIGLK